MSKKRTINKKGVCSYHLCGKRTKVFKCRYCGKYFCEEHLRAKPPSAAFSTPKTPEDYRLKEEVEKPGGHPCPPYLDYFMKKLKREETERIRTLESVLGPEYLKRELFPNKVEKGEENFSRLEEKKNPNISLRRIYYRYFKPAFKYTPFAGIILLIFIWINAGFVRNVENVSEISFFEKIQTIFVSFIESFDFSNPTQTMVTLILFITIWTGYIYWLKRIRIVRKNSKLMELLMLSIFLIIFSAHVKIDSPIGVYYEWMTSFLLFAFVIMGTIMLMKIINSLNLESDLNCWGLRILGLLFLFLSWMLFVSSSLVLVFSRQPFVMNYLGLVIAVCLFLLALFCLFRSFRRYGVFLYHKF